MNEHDQAIANELRKNSFTEINSANKNLQASKAVVIKLAAHLAKKNGNESGAEFSVFDELDYGNYE